MEFTTSMIDTYKKYKRGTDNVTQWLAQTARATGRVDDVFASTAPAAVPPKTGRLKGKARTEAKKLGLSHQETSFAVPVKDFVRLANAIVSFGKTKVPKAVLITLRAVIQGRKECARWYHDHQRNPDKTVLESNDRHQHFIQTLENVYSILQRNEEASGDSYPSKAESKPNTLNNRFSNLEIEITSAANDIPETITPATDKTIAKYTMKSTDTEDSFAIYCLIKELTDLRIQVKRTWRDFKHGKVGLEAASLTMNAAIAMIGQASDDFEEFFPRFAEKPFEHMHSKIVEFLLDQIGAKVEISPGIFFYYPRETASGEDPRDLLATILCVRTSNIIAQEFYLKDCHMMHLSSEEKRFIKCISQLAVIPPFEAGRTSALPVLENVHKAACGFIQQGRATTGVIFAFQMLLDTQDELGSFLPLPKKILQEKSQEIIAKCTAYSQSEALNIVGKSHTKVYRSWVKWFKERIELITVGDGFQRTINKWEEIQSWFSHGHEGFDLLAFHPSLCGLILMDHQSEFQAICINMAGDQTQVLAAAHFYNAAKKLDLLPDSTPWKDMDWFIEKQGAEWMYVGQPPSEPSRFSTHLILALGYSLKSFAKDYKGPSKVTNHGMNRRFRLPARFSELGIERKNTRLRKITGLSRAKDNPLTMLEWLVADYMEAKHLPRPNSSVQVLEYFMRAVEQDAVTYEFDLMGFYLRCVQLLGAIERHCYAHSPLEFAPDIRDALPMLTVIRDLLIHIGRCDPHFDPTIFKGAADILCEFVKKEGSVSWDLKEKRQTKVSRDFGIVKDAMAQQQIVPDPGLASSTTGRGEVGGFKH